MKVLMCHDFYQQHGGEDQLFLTEAALLEERGHRVVRYTKDNRAVRTMSSWQLAGATVWHHASYRELRALIREEKPEVVHLHNTFPLISPAAYYAASAERVPVVQYLQNYRLLCPSAKFLRAGRVCEDCLGRAVPWPGVVHACYRDDRAATAAVAAMLTAHRARRTWREMVDVYVTPTEFSRQKFIQGGLPGARIVVKRNVVHPDPGMGDGSGGFALFAGRLSAEKGVETMLDAWRRHLAGRVTLKIAGTGPLSQSVAEASRSVPGVEWLGALSNEHVIKLMKEARVLIFPSVWYESLPLVITEAFAVGLPVIASDLGAMSSLIQSHRTGLHFPPGEADALAAQVEWAFTHPDDVARMSREARREFEQSYSAAGNYERLMEIYDLAVGRRHVGSGADRR